MSCLSLLILSVNPVCGSVQSMILSRGNCQTRKTLHILSGRRTADLSDSLIDFADDVEKSLKAQYYMHVEDETKNN